MSWSLVIILLVVLWCWHDFVTGSLWERPGVVEELLRLGNCRYLPWEAEAGWLCCPGLTVSLDTLHGVVNATVRVHDFVVKDCADRFPHLLLLPYEDDVVLENSFAAWLVMYGVMASVLLLAVLVLVVCCVTRRCRSRRSCACLGWYLRRLCCCLYRRYGARAHTLPVARYTPSLPSSSPIVTAPGCSTLPLGPPLELGHYAFVTGGDISFAESSIAGSFMCSTFRPGVPPPPPARRETRFGHTYVAPLVSPVDTEVVTML